MQVNVSITITEDGPDEELVARVSRTERLPSAAGFYTFEAFDTLLEELEHGTKLAHGAVVRQLDLERQAAQAAVIEHEREERTRELEERAGDVGVAELERCVMEAERELDGDAAAVFRAELQRREGRQVAA